MSKEKYRSRVHMLLLYPDNVSHCEALKKIKEGYDHAGILHDQDFYTEEDSKVEEKMIDKNDVKLYGTLKKAHWHVILRFKQAVWSTAVCKDLGIEHSFIEQVKKFDNAIQYLIHYNDNNKAQYSVDDVFGNLKSRLIESINKVEKSEGEKIMELIEFINSYEGKLSITEFASYCALNGYWSEFRRSGAIFVKIIDEHNSAY